MPDLAGQTLEGRYHILELLGRGGMADVYKAWDAFRQYHVAVKVMREDLAEDPEFAQRFRREARALAQLAHENIVRFYSFEQADLTAFIVMDYVEGSTLRTEIARAKGPMPLPAVVSIVGQVTAALHYAHMMGVLHRDVKPGNIMLQPDGRALLSDFGIAKVTDTATATAVMPGTPAYMSPEHCLSQPLDARADVYSLGVVVYEMFAGRRPFVGDSTEAGTGTTAERIRREQMSTPAPPLRRFNPNLPPEVEAAVGRALAKDREQRWPSALAFWTALRQAAAPALGESARDAAAPAPRPASVAPPPAAAATAVLPPAPVAGGTVPPPAATPRPRLPALAIAAAAALGVLVLAAACVAAYLALRPGAEATPTGPAVVTRIAGDAGSGSTATPATEAETNTPLGAGTPEVVRTATAAGTPEVAATTSPRPTALPALAVIDPSNAAEVQLLTEWEAHNRWVLDVAYSADGSLLATAASGAAVRIWQRPGLQLLQTLADDGLNPDGGLAFSSDGRLLAVGSADKSVRLWTTADWALVATFSGHSGAIQGVAFLPDGSLLASASADHTVRVWRVADGAMLAELQGIRTTVFSLAFMPGGSQVLAGTGDAFVLWSLDRPDQPRVIAESDIVGAVAVSPDGALAAAGLYDGSIQLWRTEDWTLAATLEGHTKFVAALAFSPVSTVLASSSGDSSLRLWDVATGTMLNTLDADPLRPIHALAFAPDGTEIATGTGSGRVRLWGVRPGLQGLGPTATPATQDMQATAPPQTGVSNTIVWSARRSEVWNLYAAAADGSGARALTDDEPPDRWPVWSPDGTRLAFASNRQVDPPGIAVYVMNADGSGLTLVATGTEPAWSPDGTRLVYQASRDDNTDIYVANIDGSGEVRLTDDPAVDSSPDWSPDGTRIAFESDRDGNAEIYVMNVDGSDVTNLTQYAEE
ncbi:MAG: protein kinase domain-containing protein, partial [Anaerolineae bacterium]